MWKVRKRGRVRDEQIGKVANDAETHTQHRANCEGQKTKRNTNGLKCREARWGLIWGAAALLALFQTLQSATVQWSYTDITHVNNMNKTDVIKIGPAPSPPLLFSVILLWAEKGAQEKGNDVPL